MRLLLQATFLCLRLPANTFFFYLHTIYFSVYSLCKQFISKFSVFEHTCNCSFSYQFNRPICESVNHSNFFLFFFYLNCCVFQLTFSNLVLSTQDNAFALRPSKHYLSVSFRISRSLLWTPILNSILLFVPQPLVPCLLKNNDLKGPCSPKRLCALVFLF